MFRRMNLLFILVILAGYTALAQQTAIGGKINDGSGAVVVGANVTASRADGGARYSATTNVGGVYQFPAIEASDYIIHVDAKGFAKIEQKLTIRIGQTLSIDFKMQPEATTSLVTVSASADLIDTTSSQVAGNVDPEQTSKLPLNGNNWQQLSVVVPGIRENDIGNTPINKNSWGTFQINMDGQQVTQSNEFSWKGEPQFSREAISEFQISTNRFDATNGRTSLLLITAQTKSGGNVNHGSAFGYFRNSSVGSAATPVINQVLEFADQLYGGTFGGAVRKDKLFYFGSYETDRNPSTTVSTPYGFPTFTKATVNNLWKYLARFDYKAGSKNSYSLRATAHENDQPYYSLTQHWRDNSYNMQLDYNHTFSPNLISDLKLGATHNFYGQKNYFTAMQLSFPSVTLGTDIYALTAQNQENQSLREDLFWIKGTHSVKLGTELILVNEHGQYSNAQNGQATISTNVGTGALAAYTWSQIFPDYYDPTTWKLTLLNPAVLSYRQNYGDNHFKLPRKTLGAWVQDDWQLTRRLTLNLGLRYDNDYQVFNVTANYPASWNLSKPTHGDNLEFSPRVGFALDPTGSGKTSIRGGVGLYYATFMATFAKKANMLNGLYDPIPSITQTRTTTINLLDPFNGATTNNFIANPAQYSEAIFTLDPSVTTPWTVQASIGVQRAIHKAVVSVDYLHDRSHHLLIAQEKNVFADPARNFNETPSVYGRPNSNFGSILNFVTPANDGDIYDALLVNVQKLSWRKLNGSIAYTFAREKDNNVFNNPYRLAEDWGLSPDDQRHTLTPTLSYQYRWGLRSALLFHYGSGAHYNVTSGTQPTGMTQSDPASLSNRYFCGADATNPSCTTKITTYNNPAHNHLDTETGLDVTDKNQLTGRAIQRLDANLAKETLIGDRYRVTVQVEAFNVLNHANYGSYTTSITSKTFGTPLTNTDTAYWPRALQFSAKLSF